MKRLASFAVPLLLLAGLGWVGWTVAELPPVRMVWHYGISYAPEPTGEVETYEGVRFVEIGPGCFRMGSTHVADGGDLLGRWCARFGLPWGSQPEPSNEMPVHWVEFPRGFCIAETEVTNAQYEAFDPQHKRSEYSSGDSDPVLDVSWEDARKYCAWLSERSGQAIRLPSESEWECACRAGSKREFCFGDDWGQVSAYAWNNANSDGRAHEVGSRRANAWGLHDFHGNVVEWCEDIYHRSYEDALTNGAACTEGGVEPQGSLFRVRRGGSWFLPPGHSRSADRFGYHPSRQEEGLGFRPAFRPSEN